MVDQKLRRVVVFKEDENKAIEVITNQLTWKTRIIAGLCKKDGTLNCSLKPRNKTCK
jgi:hypothetical protein